MRTPGCCSLLFLCRLSSAALLAATFATGPTLASAEWQSSASLRVGLDTNPLGESHPRDDSTLVTAGLTLTRPGSPGKFSYLIERAAFDAASTENFTAHRLTLHPRWQLGEWRFAAEGATAWLDGSRETPLASTSVNANAITLWRERRAQWQHRGKIHAERSVGPRSFVRLGARALIYDYTTRVQAGHFALADRSDAQASLDLGWQARPSAHWLLGVRVGAQQQATVPLPGSAFDYSNRFTRFALGWEGKLFSCGQLTFAAGPDFRRYTGTVDETVFLAGRHRDTWWAEAGWSAPLGTRWKISGKAARTPWLSSTGKSAYFDTSLEAATHYAFTPQWHAQFTARWHRCDYYPLARDDAERLLGPGLTWQPTARITLSAELWWHRATNRLTSIPARTFDRFTANLGVTRAF